MSSLESTMTRVPSWRTSSRRSSRPSRRDRRDWDGPATGSGGVGLYLVDPKLSTNPHGALNPSRGGGERGRVDHLNSSQGTPLMRTGLVRGGRRPCELTGEVGGGGEDGGNGEDGTWGAGGGLDRGRFGGPLGRLVNLSLSVPPSTHSCFHAFSQSFLLRPNAKSHIFSNSCGGRVSERWENVDLSAPASRASSISIISRAKRASRAFLSASSSC